MLKRSLAALFVAILLSGSTVVRAQSAGAAAGGGDDRTILITADGKVDVTPKGVSAWRPGRTNQVLNVGDRLRTGKNSRATLRLSNLSVLRVFELTTLEIQPTEQTSRASLNLESGAAYLFNRDRPGETQFRTPTASGAIRGTEFNLAVDDNGKTVLTLLDGEVELSNELGTINLRSGEQGIVEKNQAPRKTAVIDAINIIQWALYYPAVLDVDELNLPPDAVQALSSSLENYRAGDLLRALESYPSERSPGSEAERVYKAGLLLAVGNVSESEMLLSDLRGERPAALGNALREVIAAVKQQPWSRNTPRTLATEFLAGSYYEQSHSRLDEALKLAKQAQEKSPDFGFASARVAELEFSFGHTSDASIALEKSLAVAPRNAQALALKGFLLAARNKNSEATASFDAAIAADGSLGNAWLGRGLMQIRRGDAEAGRSDLQIAAALEPNRAVLRSYLGKAFSNAGDPQRARKELALARTLDPNDPTAWLYSALLNQQRNRINEAVADLEKSQELNDNRSLFRSKLLLDQDRAVRGANLAQIYRDAGMTEVSVREASRAVNSDYGNYSAHLFLAESYDVLRDPKQINLRYETPFFSELLVANLLAPVGGGTLSQNISQQEYSRLFEGNRLGVSSRTEYFSSGDWRQDASQFGVIGNSSYALDASYLSDAGQRPNNDFENLFLSAKVKQQITPQDSVYFQTTYQRFEGGDLLQYYDQRDASRTVRVKEIQEPNIFAGYHHEWSPGNHTLFLAARLDDTLTLQDPGARALFFQQANGQTTRVETPGFASDYRRELEAYSAELQQILTVGSQTFVAGARYQFAFAETTNSLIRAGVSPPTPLTGTPEVDSDLWRVSIYGYDAWDILDELQLTAGVTYDRLHYPVNIDTRPITSRETEKDQFSPKIGMVWTPFRNTHLRAAYTRSLGGVFFDNSVRLEPTQIAGFNQAYRSLIPESIAGLVPGTEFETWGVGLDHTFPTKTYIVAEGEILNSRARRTVGVVTNSFFIPVPNRPSSRDQKLDFSEQSFALTLNQLVSDEWAVGARYRFSYADFDGNFLDPGAGALDQNLNATLQQLNLYAIYNLPCGFFSQFQALWTTQSNQGSPREQPGDDFWQFNVYAGYRFPQRHAEVRVGLLNIADRDYRLNPLNLYSELPRDRILTVSVKLNF